MKLSADQISERLASCPGWTARDGVISKTYTLSSFPDAIAFVTRLAFDAEAADHHPDLQINYKKVTVNWSTHDAGGLTEKDFAGAKQSDMIAARTR
jgi:4a-hydroxytetrahydrobiopterin dehydratase